LDPYPQLRDSPLQLNIKSDTCSFCGAATIYPRKFVPKVKIAPQACDSFLKKVEPLKDERLSDDDINADWFGGRN
jgi:hypothetical protein